MINVILNISDYLFSFLCHQQQDLLAILQGHVFPFCYRCAGIYLGIALTLTFMNSISNLHLPWSIGFSLVIIMLAEWIFANSGIIASTALSRSLTGLFAGIGVCIMLSGYLNRFRIFPFIIGILILFFTPLYPFAVVIELVIALTLLLFWSKVLQSFICTISRITQKGEHYAKLSKTS